MRKQIFDRDFAGRGISLVEWAARVLKNAPVLQFGRPFDDRIFKSKLSFLDKHHGEGGGYRLGHRGNAENRVAPHGKVVFDNTQSEGGVEDFAVPPNKRDESGWVARRDCVLGGLEKRFKALRRADFARHDVPTT